MPKQWEVSITEEQPYNFMSAGGGEKWECCAGRDNDTNAWVIKSQRTAVSSRSGPP